MNRQQFSQWLIDHSLSLSELQLDSYQTYLQLLIEWNQKMNLTAIDTEEEIWDKHFADCLSPLTSVKLSGTVADIGSGAGFPGLVWAIACPDVNFTLIEPTTKRCTFLSEVVKTLGLTNVEIINKRAEDLAGYRERFDAVSARAVANLSVLSELCIPLLKVNGLFIALKGSQAKTEVDAAAHALSTLHTQLISESEYVAQDGGHHITLVLKKIKQTPSQYPRLYAKIKKNPL